MHEEEVDFTGVVDEEHLVAGWCQVPSLLVATVTNLFGRLLVIANPHSIDCRLWRIALLNNAVGWDVGRNLPLA